MKPDDPRRKNLRRGGHGRQKGCLNKVTRDVRELAEKFISDPAYLKGLARRLKNGRAPHMETLLWYYAKGKPKETVGVEFPQGVPPLSVIIQPATASTRT